MIGRPRCREWTPLATQQLRLRSLIQIVGYNIRPPEGCKEACSFYMTLHHTTMSAPFYTSERISSAHPKWKEIDNEITQRMSSTNVVIRIWCHMLHSSRDSEDRFERPPDTIIQTWGVYFSGLRYICANLSLNFTSDCFKSNTLVFQMHGGYFCSYKSLKLDIIPDNEMDPGSFSSDSSDRTNLSRVVLVPKSVTVNKINKEYRSISPHSYNRRSDSVSKSQSPVDRGIKYSFTTMRTSASLNIAQSQRRNDSAEQPRNHNHIYEHSPDSTDIEEFRTSEANCIKSIDGSKENLYNSKIDKSETAENYDLRNETAGVPKYRYMALSFLKSEIRPSYNATKLQKLHLLQYSIKKKQEAVQEIRERIYKISSVTDDGWSQLDETELKLKFKNRSQRNLFSPEDDSDKAKREDSLRNGRISDRPIVSKGPRLTLRLNDLLSFKSKPSPFQRAEHIRLTKQLEIYRFKRIILADERDSKCASIRRLKERHAKLCEENQDVGLELLENYHSLSRRNEELKLSRQSCGALRELAARSHAALACKRGDLIAELHDIFYITQKDPITWSILDVHLPICGDEYPRSNAVTDSVAAGYVAQTTCLAAAILNLPLRYKITLMGSASKILDVTPDLPDPNIPLFPRGNDLTLFRYALFLLNKCIGQLLYGRGIPVVDMRPTLFNLQRLLLTASNLSDTSKLFGTHKWLIDNQSQRTQSLRSLVASERGKYRPFNRFKDSVDGQSPETAMNLRRHRLSRSVGSYDDAQELSELDASTTSIMGSEPNIYDSKLTQSEPAHTPIKGHSSDPDISKMAQTEKVVFTLGGEMIDQSNQSNNSKEMLVKISTNNDDEAYSSRGDDNVKKICSEINTFCLNTEDSINTIEREDENIDTAEYMEKKNCFEDSCETCVENVNCEDCEESLKNDIVIPSAGAILDTGQIATSSNACQNGTSR